jgi:hypothetical protein
MLLASVDYQNSETTPQFALHKEVEVGYFLVVVTF